jgi:hypothetical protein
MGMTGMSLKVLLVAIVAVGVVGLLARRIASLLSGPLSRRMPSRPTSRSYRIPELTPDEVARGVTIYVPISHLGDAGQVDDIGVASRVRARRVPLGM